MAGRVLAFARPEMTAQEAIDAFVSSHPAAGTRRTYRQCLDRVAGQLGGGSTALTAWTTEALSRAFETAYGDVAPATRNTRVATVRSFLTYARGHGWPVGDTELVADRARVDRDDTKAIPRATLDRLFEAAKLTVPWRETLWPVPLREKTLWRLLYESAGRAGSVLALDIGDLDLENKRARVITKGGAVRWIQWQSGTARLLPRLIAGRRSGPLFLTTRAPSPARTPAAGDVCPHTGRGRLSYRRAETLFKGATSGLDPAREGHTLHQLRHSRLTHLGEDGWSAPMLMALSGHTRLSTLAIYTHISPEAVAAALARQDPDRRHR